MALQRQQHHRRHRRLGRRLQPGYRRHRHQRQSSPLGGDLRRWRRRFRRYLALAVAGGGSGRRFKREREGAFVHVSEQRLALLRGAVHRRRRLRPAALDVVPAQPIVPGQRLAGAGTVRPGQQLRHGDHRQPQPCLAIDAGRRLAGGAHLAGDRPERRRTGANAGDAAGGRPGEDHAPERRRTLQRSSKRRLQRPPARRAGSDWRRLHHQRRPGAAGAGAQLLAGRLGVHIGGRRGDAGSLRQQPLGAHRRLARAPPVHLAGRRQDGRPDPHVPVRSRRRRTRHRRHERHGNQPQAGVYHPPRRGRPARGTAAAGDDPRRYPTGGLVRLPDGTEGDGQLRLQLRRRPCDLPRALRVGGPGREQGTGLRRRTRRAGLRLAGRGRSIRPPPPGVRPEHDDAGESRDARRNDAAPGRSLRSPRRVGDAGELRPRHLRRGDGDGS